MKYKELEVDTHIKSWPERIATAKQNGLSQKLIAEKIKIDKSFLSDILRGKDITVKTYRKIENGLRKMKI